MAVGKFIQDGLFLEVSDTRSNMNNKILLQKGLLK
jgi:hypothetical protein